MKKQAFILFLLGTILVVLLHIAATKYSLYYIFWWYDSLLHILGGIALGFLGIFWFGRSWIRGITFTAIIAVAWEVFERLGHVWWPAYVGFGGTGDTILDILCAILGAAFVLIITRRNN